MLINNTEIFEDLLNIFMLINIFYLIGNTVCICYWQYDYVNYKNTMDGVRNFLLIS